MRQTVKLRLIGRDKQLQADNPNLLPAMNLIKSLRVVCGAMMAAFFTSCAGVGPAVSGPTPSAWQRYLHASPFSYSTSDSITVVKNLSAELDAIPLNDLHPRVAAHIQAVKRWTASYPAYRIRAGEAYSDAYHQGKIWEKPSEWLGEKVGQGMSDDDGLSQAFGGFLGEMIGRLGNEVYSQSSGQAAAARVMRPLIEQARYLSAEEFEIDRMLGVAPSNHLRRMLGRLGQLGN